MNTAAAMRAVLARVSASLPTTAVLAGLGLAAQEAVPPRPQRDAAALAAALASADAAVVAWAAHDAQALGDKSLAVPLQKSLHAWTADASDAGRHACLFALDALVALRVRMPPADLLPLLDDRVCGVAAFVLLARDPQQNEAELFATFQRDLQAAHEPTTAARDLADRRPFRMLASGNLLCAQRTPGFAAAAFAMADLDLRAVVVAQGAMAELHDTTSWTLGRPPPIPAGLPPVPNYTLARSDRADGRGLEQLAPGPIAVAWRRTLPPNDADGRVTLSSGDLPRARPEVLLWLLELAGRRRVPMRTRIFEFADAPGCLAAIEQARAELQAFRERLLQDLVAARVMTTAEALPFAKAKVAVRVDDQRTDQSVPLPAIPTTR